LDQKIQTAQIEKWTSEEVKQWLSLWDGLHTFQNAIVKQFPDGNALKNIKTEIELLTAFLPPQDEDETADLHGTGNKQKPDDIFDDALNAETPSFSVSAVDDNDGESSLFAMTFGHIRLLWIAIQSLVNNQNSTYLFFFLFLQQIFNFSLRTKICVFC